MKNSTSKSILFVCVCQGDSKKKMDPEVQMSGLKFQQSNITQVPSVLCASDPWSV